MAKNDGYDITGQRFGKLVVLGKGISRGPGRTTWRCLCDCGNEKTIRGDALKSGVTKSCGQCHHSKAAEKDLFDEIPVPVAEIEKSARRAGLSFGQYTAREFSRRLFDGGKQ